MAAGQGNIWHGPIHHGWMPTPTSGTTGLHKVIHRIEVPVDDRPHGIDLTGDILHTAVRRNPASVDVWFQARRDDTEHMRRSFQIVGTGQPIPAWLDRHHGTAISSDGQLVWHLLENHCPHPKVLEVPRVASPVDRVPGICEACRVDLVGNGHGVWRPQ